MTQSRRLFRVIFSFLRLVAVMAAYTRDSVQFTALCRCMFIATLVAGKGEG